MQPKKTSTSKSATIKEEMKEGATKKQAAAMASKLKGKGK